MDTGVRQELHRRDYQSDIQFLRKDQGIADSVISLTVTVAARCEVVVQIGLSKSLQNFMDYPNDPQRGHDIMHMPIQFRYSGGGGEWKRLTSAALLV